MEKLHNILRKALPTVVAILVFGVVSVIGFAPQLEGRVLPQHDIRQFDGMSRDIRECRADFDEDPQWTGAMFSGMPAYQINIKYPAQIIKRTVDWVQSLFATPASMVFFAMLSAFVMALLMGMSAWVGIIVGLAYGLSTYFFLIIGAGHITKMWALVYAPAMLGSIHYTLRQNMWIGGALTAFFASLEAGANHPQITYYFVLAAAALFISELVFAIKNRVCKNFAQRTAVLVGAAILALGANFAPLYYTMQHTSDTTRGGSALAVESERKGLDIDYATAWSYGIDESWNMLIPDFMGGDSGATFSKDGEVAESLKRLGADRRTAEQIAQQLPTYWGEQPYTAGPTYIGAIVIFLALLGLMLADDRNRWWILAATILAILMSWGYHAMWFTELCFNYLPLYDKFRAVSTALVVVEWSAPLLAGMALWQIWQKWEDKKFLTRKIAIAAGITAGLCLIFAVAGSSMFNFGEEESVAMMGQAFGDAEVGAVVAEAMAAERASILATDAWRSAVYILLAAGVLLVALRIDKRWRTGALALVAALIVADILPINLRYLPYETFVEKRNTKIYPTDADKQIMADKEPGYRVFNLTVSPFNDATTSMFHRSIGGYHGAKMGRYQDLIDHYLSNGHEAVLDMLNTKYLITKDGVIERPTAYGAAWFVNKVEIVDSADEELAALGKVDLRTTAVAEAGAPRPHIEGAGDIELKEYRPNYLRYDYTLTGGNAVAIFSEIYYDKGWSAYLDGEPCDSFRADYLLRAMVLPEGQHTVEWRFKAPNWSLAEAVTLICSILIIFALVIPTILKCYGSCKKKHIS
ncbi:MAG: hypothetical protein J6Q01_04380 [Alistipes sp.]|nr:hypothetical protein [Alistipes sp.]